MIKVMKELKSEISRLARKEINAELSPIRKVNAAQRGFIADLRRQVSALQKEMSVLKQWEPATKNAVNESSSVADVQFRVSGKGIKALRKRFGITQTALARLADVSGPAVVQWEKNSGKIRLRRKTAQKLQEIFKMKKRDVTAQLGKRKES